MGQIMRHAISSVVVMAGFLMLAGGAAAQNAAIPPALPANPTPGVAAPDASPTAPASTAGDDAIVCKYEKMTGSLMTSRVCRTQRAWKLMQTESQELLRFDNLGSKQIGGN
jgi:hypothetical protein